MIGYRTNGICPLDGRETNCTENCKYCLEEEEKERKANNENSNT